MAEMDNDNDGDDDDEEEVSIEEAKAEAVSDILACFGALILQKHKIGTHPSGEQSSILSLTGE